MKKQHLSRLGPDPLARLRRIRGDETIEEDGVREAVKRLYQTKDGQILFNWMIAQSYGKTLAEDASESALRANEVRKKFVDRIMALASEEPRASGQPNSSKPRQ